MRIVVFNILILLDFLLPNLVKADENCGTQIGLYSMCMRERLGETIDYKLDGDFLDEANIFQCKLVDCLKKQSCLAISSCPDSSIIDLKVPGNITIESTVMRKEVLLANVESFRQKSAECTSKVIAEKLKTRLEGCVRTKLNLTTTWSLPIFSAQQLQGNLTVLTLARNTIYQAENVFREITRKLSKEAGFTCPDTISRRAAQRCIANEIENAENQLKNSSASLYSRGQKTVMDFCDARDTCEGRMSVQCQNAYLSLQTTINDCYDWSGKSIEQDVLGPYIRCLSEADIALQILRADSRVMLFKTMTTRSLSGLMREDLQVRTKKFSGNISEFQLNATDECNPLFELSNRVEIDGTFNLIKVTDDSDVYLLVPTTKEDGEVVRRRKREADKEVACKKFDGVQEQMQKQCSASGSSFSSTSSVGISGKRSVETALAASENAFESGVVGPSILVKQFLFGLNHPFLKYQELLNAASPPYRRLTRYGHE